MENKLEGEAATSLVDGSLAVCGITSTEPSKGTSSVKNVTTTPKLVTNCPRSLQSYSQVLSLQRNSQKAMRKRFRAQSGLVSPYFIGGLQIVPAGMLHLVCYLGNFRFLWEFPFVDAFTVVFAPLLFFL